MRFFRLPFLLSCLIASPCMAAQYSLDDDLIYRINFGSAQDVKLLLDRGANPNIRNRQNESCLEMAIELNSDETTGMVQALIDKGADMNIIDKKGDVPLIKAIHYKEDGAVKALLAKGANYHITAGDGTPILKYAQQQGDKEGAAMIQALIGKEEAYAYSLRTPERFHEFVRVYVSNSCIYQYWSYVLASRQLSEKEAEITKKVQDIKAVLLQIIGQVQKYYTPASMQAVQNVGNQAANQIYAMLDVMISNTNRTEHGVGTETDATKRCEKIIAGLNLDLVPVALNPEAETPRNPSAPAAASPSALPPAALTEPRPVNPPVTR